LFKAGVHPDRIGKEISKEEFDRIWFHTVQLLKRGYQTGSILTVDPEEAKALGKPNMRRYIYNTSKCPRCSSNIKTWGIAGRTCYACQRCQPLDVNTGDGSESRVVAVVSPLKDCDTFNSHCAPESVVTRLSVGGPARLTVKELKAKLEEFAVTIPSHAKKSELVELLSSKMTGPSQDAVLVSPESAAAEKAAAGESLAVEHVADLAPGQQRKARARALKMETSGDVTTRRSNGQETRNKVFLLNFRIEK